MCFGRYALCQRDEIGRGSYGKVVIAKEQSERRVAIKIFTEAHEVKHEVAILSHLGAHRCILPVLDHSVEPPAPYMVMPYKHGGTVMHLLRYSEIGIDAQTGIVAQLADGLSWIHTCNVAHLDVKPANMLWDNRYCSLTIVDFGLSMRLKETGEGTPANDITPRDAVTPNYRPPELWKNLLSNNTQCMAVDVWSFGVTAIEVYARRLMFGGKQDDRVHRYVTEWVSSWANKRGNSLLVNVPVHVRNVVWFCCSPDPTRRPRMHNDLVAWGQSESLVCPMRC